MTFFCLPRVLLYFGGGIRYQKLTHVAMGLFMLCAWHNAIFTALPCKHNWQAAINSTMEAKHNTYLHFKDKRKSPCVSLTSHVSSKKICYTLLHVCLHLQILAAENTCLQCVFPVFLNIICYIESLKTEIQKSPCQSLKRYQWPHLSTHLYYISLWFCSGFGCQN